MSIKLNRDIRNPIILPEPSHLWESRFVFNCAVVKDDELFHLVYRAMGVDEVSRIGYAISTDGVHFSRLDKPVFSPATGLEAKGCEDPRLTKLNGEYYMVYTAYSKTGTRVSMASTKNFITWKRYGVIIPDQNDKDAALFPEKVNGRYMLYHRIEPDMWVAFSDDLVHWTDNKIVMSPRKNSWDSLKIGIGATPIKTSHGWLMLYHGVDQNLIYRLGFALFDLKDPTKLLKRSNDPILEPEEDFELFGQIPNVVFSDTMIVNNNEYVVYYGGADNCIAIAKVSVSDVEKEF